MVAEADYTDDGGFTIDNPVLRTERLVMRAPCETDIDQLVALADNRHVAEMLARMPHPYGIEEARAFLAMARAPRGGIVYALTLAENGAFVGCAGLNSTDRGLNWATGSANRTGSVAMPPRQRTRWSTLPSPARRSRSCMPRPE